MQSPCYLIEAPEGTPAAGRLVSSPSHSPENTFTKADGTESEFTYAASMDLEIIHDLFTGFLEANQAIDPSGNLDKEFRSEVATALAKMQPLQISEKTGRLQEWIEDYAEKDPRHRHTSHLYGLHPGQQIAKNGTPELFEAARKSLEARGDGGKGWSMAWKVNFWARFHNGKRTHQLLGNLLRKMTLTNQGSVGIRSNMTEPWRARRRENATRKPSCGRVLERCGSNSATRVEFRHQMSGLLFHFGRAAVENLP